MADPINDRLKHLFDLQYDFQHQIGNGNKIYKGANNVDSEYVREQTLALIDEIMEALRETAWKTWKKNQHLNHDNMKEELIDAWHFLINLSMAAGMDSAEVYDLFVKKSQVNRDRQFVGR